MRWYKGDLHSHSVYSDGNDTLDVLFERVRQNGLDFFALTDHKTVEHLQHLPEISDITIIPAFEFGDKLGHANIFGITELLSQNRSLEAEQTKKSLIEAKQAGAYIAINHPFHYESTWLLPLEGIEYDWIELWNGPWFNSNEHCLNWWQGELEKGKKIPVAGGSDCHGNFPFHYFGQPTTWVYTEKPEISEILKALKNGHSVLSYSPDGPFIDLRCGCCIPGDIIKDGHSSCFLKISSLVKTDIVRIITDKGVFSQIAIENDGEFADSPDVPGCKFIRVEVLRYYDELMAYQMAALTNPIYFEVHAA